MDFFILVIAELKVVVDYSSHGTSLVDALLYFLFTHSLIRHLDILFIKTCRLYSIKRYGRRKKPSERLVKTYLCSSSRLSSCEFSFLLLFFYIDVNYIIFSSRFNFVISNITSFLITLTSREERKKTSEERHITCSYSVCVCV